MEDWSQQCQHKKCPHTCQINGYYACNNFFYIYANGISKSTPVYLKLVNLLVGLNAITQIKRILNLGREVLIYE
jgi:hypothetical protein